MPQTLPVKPEPLTPGYIENHTHNLHTPESFTRALVEQILQSAKEQVRAAAQDEVEVGATFKVAAYQPLACITLTAVVNGVQISYHVNT